MYPLVLIPGCDKNIWSPRFADFYILFSSLFLKKILHTVSFTLFNTIFERRMWLMGGSLFDIDLRFGYTNAWKNKTGKGLGHSPVDMVFAVQSWGPQSRLLAVTWTTAYCRACLQTQCCDDRSHKILTDQFRIMNNKGCLFKGTYRS